jgi:enoyl-CoA hydratase/carnithine racemase
MPPAQAFGLAARAGATCLTGRGPYERQLSAGDLSAMPIMDYEQITAEVADGVMTVTLNRPQRLNAWTGQMGAELMDAFDRSDADDDVRAVIVTGEGRGFCAGADLGGGGETFDYRARGATDPVPRDNGGELTLRVFRSTKPVIAAINGPAVGVGATMTLPMDVRLASEEARIGFVFARRGIIPEACSSWFLPRIVGISQAMEWVATGPVQGSGSLHKVDRNRASCASRRIVSSSP